MTVFFPTQPRLRLRRQAPSTIPGWEEGIGANARGSLFHKHVDVGLHFLAGEGVGRYGTTGLPDATVRPDGTLALVRGYQALGTLEWHSAKWDIYANAGGEYAARTSYLNSAGGWSGLWLTPVQQRGLLE